MFKGAVLTCKPVDRVFLTLYRMRTLFKSRGFTFPRCAMSVGERRAKGVLLPPISLIQDPAVIMLGGGGHILLHRPSGLRYFG